MSDTGDRKQSREERLAAKLRENLRRRKTQSRAIARAESDDTGVSNPPEAG